LGGINPGGLIEQYWWGEQHIYRYRADGRLLFDHRPEFRPYYNFIKDIPLNNGNYQDVAAVVSNDRLRVLGQKDLTRGWAHLWVQNIDRTWFTVNNAVSILPAPGFVRITGFQPNFQYQVQWWNSYEADPSEQVIRRETATTDASGSLQLNISNLRTDAAVQIKPLE